MGPVTHASRQVRLFRLLTVMNKIQRSRASANMMRKKAKYRKVGSPVERVLEILQGLKVRRSILCRRPTLCLSASVC